jgi:hypothetical protein
MLVAIAATASKASGHSWSGWSSQVNATLIGGIILLVVAGLTYLGVVKQIKSNREIAREQLAQDTKQRHLDRVDERNRMLVDGRLQVLSAFSDAVSKVDRALALLIAAHEGGLAEYGVEQSEWSDHYLERIRAVESAYGKVFEAFGWTGELDDFANQIHTAMWDSTTPIERFFAALNARTHAMRPEQGNAGIKAEADYQATKAQLQEGRFAIDDALMALRKAAHAAAWRVEQ